MNAEDKPKAEAGRRPNPRGQGSRLRDQIIEEASTLLAASGDVSQLSLRAVAKQVGIAATSVYLHFPDVEHLAAAVAERRFTELNASLTTAAEGVVDPRAVLLIRCRAYCHFALDHPGHYRVMFQAKRPDLATTVPYILESSPGHSTLDSLTQDIKRCQEAGLASGHDDPFQLATLLWSMLHGLVSLRMSRPRFPWPSLDEMVIEAVERLVGLPRTTNE